MKSLITIIGITLLMANSAMASSSKYVCGIVTLDEEADQWTAIVDLKNNSAELSSENSIFGDNPFAKLNLAGEKLANQYVDGVIVFSGTNNTVKADKYILIFNPKTTEIEFEARENKGKTRWFGNGKCRAIK